MPNGNTVIPSQQRHNSASFGPIRCAALKANQPKLWNAALDAKSGLDLDHPEHETCQRAHGRIDRHRVWSTLVPSTITFPHAKTYIIVERESSTLNDTRVSIETRYYVTDLTAEDATIEHFFRLVHGHWSIENSLHWVRSTSPSEKTCPKSAPELSLASSQPYATSRSASSATPPTAPSTSQPQPANSPANPTSHSIARQPDIALDLLGIPRILCK